MANGILWEGRLTTMHQIMVVDDDAHIRAALKLRLEREAYRVRLARDGAEALEMSVPEAMRFAMTGGMSTTSGEAPP